mgnify:CR=1 FL=1
MNGLWGMESRFDSDGGAGCYRHVPDKLWCVPPHYRRYGCPGGQYMRLEEYTVSIQGAKALVFLNLSHLGDFTRR